MEDGHIATNGERTLVDVEIGGKLRRISVSREWIEDYLKLTPERAAQMTAAERQEFVRTHLSGVISAAKAKLSQTYSGADLIMVHTQDN